MYRPTNSPAGLLIQSPQQVYSRPQQQIRSQSPTIPYYNQPQQQSQRPILQTQSQQPTLKSTLSPQNTLYPQQQIITQRISSPQTLTFSNPLQQSIDISSQILSSLNAPVTPPTQKVQVSTIQPAPQIIIPAPQPVKQDKPIQVVDIKQYEALWQRRLDEAIRQHETQFGQAKERQENEKYEKQAKDREIDNLQQRIKEHEERSDQSENTLQYYKRLAEELQNSLNDAREGLEQKNSLIGQLEYELEQKNNKIADQSRDLQKQYTITSELQREITQASQRYGVALDDLDRANQEIRTLNNELKSRKDQSSQKEQQILKLQEDIRQLNIQVTNLEEENRIEADRFAEDEQQLISRAQMFETEMKTWKQKFVDVNRDFHIIQENLNLKEVELEHLQKTFQARNQAATDLRSSTNARRSTKGITERSPMRSSDYVQSALNESDLAKIQQLSGIQQK